MSRVGGGRAEGEGEAGFPLSREPDMGPDPRTPGPQPEPKADTQRTEPPGPPKIEIFLLTSFMKELGLPEIEDRKSLISAHGVVASGGEGDVTGSKMWLVVKNMQLAPSSFSLLLSQLSRLGFGEEGMTRLWAFS